MPLSRLLLASVPVLLAACVGEPSRAASSPAADASPPPAAAPIASSHAQADSAAVQQVTFRGARYYVLRVHTRTARIQMHWRDERNRPYGGPAVLGRALAARGERVIAVTSAGIYSREDTPKGLHVERGRVVVPLNLKDSTAGNFFRPRPNGVFAVMRDGTVRIVRRDAAGALVPRMMEATQSGPRLLHNGAAVSSFGNIPLRRTAIGVASPREAYVVVSRDPVSLNDLAALFRDRLGCTEALFLDGGAVQGLYAPADGIAFETNRFVGLLAVVENTTRGDPQGR